MQMNIHHFQVRRGTSRTAHKPSMKSVRFNFTKRITAASAVFAIILVCTSCGSSNKSQSYKTSQEAVNAYSSYLSEVKNKKELTSDKLFVEVEKWRVIRDSVVACLRKDTTSTLHQDWHQTYQVIHDSLRKEFCRVVLTKPRTYNDVLQLKEVASSYMQDEDLKQAKHKDGLLGLGFIECITQFIYSDILMQVSHFHDNAVPLLQLPIYLALHLF